MMWKGAIRRNTIKTALCSLTLLPACASCIYDAYVDAPESDDENTVNVGLTIRTGSMTNGVEDLQSSDYENYIDIGGDDVRIYFFTNKAADNENNTFDGNDTFIARFEPWSMRTDTDTDYTEYTMYGAISADMKGYHNFKIMVLANWGEEAFAQADENVTTGTTIDDVCSAEWAQFTAFSTDDFILDADHLMPFYGIHAYTDKTFKQGEAVMLDDEPITLLRAMAKVEVELETEGVAFNDVTIRRYNAKGYCAPAGVYSQADYGQGDNGGMQVHLVGDANDSDAAGHSMSFKKVQGANTDNGIYETWVAYLPEYDNTTDSNDYAYIEVTVDGDDTYPLYFANYTDGKTDNSYENNERMDIRRNNLYSFTVNLNSKLEGADQSQP